MILHTGGSAFGEISTRSNPWASDKSKASLRLTMPPLSMFSPTILTNGARINPLILCSASFLNLRILLL